MAEFPTYEKMVKNVAEKVLDEFLYDGRSIREWIQIIAQEDCISRQAVHDLLATWLSDYLTDETREALEVIDGKVADLPSVTPRQKMGRWERTEYSPGLCNYHCSECHNISLDIGNYCPNCGAKMEVDV